MSPPDLASKQQLAIESSLFVARHWPCPCLHLFYSNPGLYAIVSLHTWEYSGFSSFNRHTPIQHTVFFQYTEQIATLRYATPDGACILQGIYILPPASPRVRRQWYKALKSLQVTNESILYPHASYQMGKHLSSLYEHTGLPSQLAGFASPQLYI